MPFAQLVSSSKDVKLLLGQKFIRMIAYGQTTLVLGQFLKILSFSDSQVGFFMSATLLGDVALSIFLSYKADAYGRRFVMVLGCLLMIVSGIVFASSSDFTYLLLAAVFGVISASGEDSGPFRAVEESSMAQLTTAEDRSTIYAWYGMFSIGGQAFGAFVSGFIIDTLSKRKYEKEWIYRVIFMTYSICAVFKLIFTILLSSDVEPRPIPERQRSVPAGTAACDSIDSPADNPVESETQPLLSNNNSVFDIVKETNHYPLVALFALDSLGYGFMPTSWIILYFSSHFHVSDQFLATMMTICYLLSSVTPFGSTIAYRAFGSVHAMVMTHLPSALMLSMVPFATNKWGAVSLYLGRILTNSMDVVPRQVFLSQILPDSKRTSTMGAVNVAKTLGASVGPYLSGQLAQRQKLWVSFLIGGLIEATYDGCLLIFYGDTSKRLAQNTPSN